MLTSVRLPDKSSSLGMAAVFEETLELEFVVGLERDGVVVVEAVAVVVAVVIGPDSVTPTVVVGSFRLSVITLGVVVVVVVDVVVVADRVVGLSSRVRLFCPETELEQIRTKKMKKYGNPLRAAIFV
jgi:hypothetical protein